MMKDTRPEESEDLVSVNIPTGKYDYFILIARINKCLLCLQL